jgi:hypothetical protein
LVETTLQDIRYGLRMMLKHKGFTLLTVCGLALAIGANTAVVTIVNAVLFSNMSFPGSERLAYLFSFDTAHGEAEPLEAFSHAEYRDLKERMKSFDDLAAFQYGGVTLSDDANFPEGYFIARITTIMSLLHISKFASSASFSASWRLSRWCSHPRASTR